MKLKLQHFGCLMQRTDSGKNTLMLREIEGRRRKGRQKMRLLDGITDLMNMNLSKLNEQVETEIYHYPFWVITAYLGLLHSHPES